MKLTVSLEARFFRTPDQKIWAESIPDYSFWCRYLDAFDFVEIVARVQDVVAVPPTYMRSDGDKVSFVPLPYYIGPLQYLLNAHKIMAITRAVVKSADAVILRTPGQVSSNVFRYLRKDAHPYGVEVVGDPYDVFAPGSIDHPLRAFFRWWGAKQLKQQCRLAVAATYVTENALQKRYPCSQFSTYFSDVELPFNTYESSPRGAFGSGGVFNLVLVGSLAQLYKSPDILIEAVALCRTKGHKLTLNIIGDGKFRHQLEEQVARMGLNDSISFLGQLPAGGAVRAELLKADLFILPSRTEGLPRAMIEAMACGLPCIGSTVGGIPELLPVEDLVPSGSVQALADKIEEIITHPVRMQAMSARNFEKSLEFRNDILEHRRREFYNHLHEKTALWLEEKKTLK
jgi:glycosyltransferase involved in cell wall biosynthesis